MSAIPMLIVLKIPTAAANLVSLVTEGNAVLKV